MWRGVAVVALAAGLGLAAAPRAHAVEARAIPRGTLALVVEGEGPNAVVTIGRRSLNSSARIVDVRNRFAMRVEGCTWHRVADRRVERANVRSLVPMERLEDDVSTFGAVNTSVLAALVMDIDPRAQTCYRETLERVAAGRGPFR